MIQCAATAGARAGGEDGDSCFPEPSASHTSWRHALLPDVRLPGIQMWLSAVLTGRYQPIYS